jgi:hypothetical protein
VGKVHFGASDRNSTIMEEQLPVSMPIATAAIEIRTVEVEVHPHP